MNKVLIILLAAMTTWGVCPLAWASPSDVRGSGNVAVTGYSNSSGIYVLWSNGRITDSKGKEVNAATAYDEVTVSKLPAAVSGHINGAPLVAVDAFSDSEATYVVFADGKVKKPRHSGASAPEKSAEKVVQGTNVTAGMSKSGDCGWRCSIQTNSEPFYMEITFNKSFARVPNVQYNCVSYGEYNGGTKRAEPKESRCVATTKGFKIYFLAEKSANNAHRYYMYVPYSVSFVAREGEELP